MSAARTPSNGEPPGPRPAISLWRLLLLTLLTAAVAFVLQAVLAATDVPGAGAIIVLVLPLAAGAMVFAGLRPYPAAGRLRLAVMVAVGLFLLGLMF